MALQKQPVLFNFAKGQNSKVDPWQLPPDQFQTFQNTSFETVGLSKKRNGYGSLPALPNANYKNLGVRNGVLNALGGNVATFTDYQTWNTTGTLPNLTLKTTSFVKNSYNTLNCDSWSDPTFPVVGVVWSQSDGNVYFQVNDSDTGQVVFPAVKLNNGTGTGARVFPIYDNTGALNFFCTWLENATALYGYLFNAEQGTVVTGRSLLSNSLFGAGGSSSYDATWNSLSANNTLVFFYYKSGKTVAQATYSFGTGWTAISDISGSSFSNYMGPIAVAYDSANTNFYVGYFTDQKFYYSIRKINGTEVKAQTLINNLGGIPVTAMTMSASSGTCTALIQENGTTSGNVAWAGASLNYGSILYSTMTTSSATSVVVSMYDLGLASKLYNQNGTLYYLAAYGYDGAENLQPSYFLMQYASGVSTVVAKLAYSNGAGYAYTYYAGATSTTGSFFSHLPNISYKTAVDKTTVSTVDSLSFVYRYAFQSQPGVKGAPGGSNFTGVYEQIGINFAIFAFNGYLNNKDIQGNLEICGGVLTQFDGVNCNELGFNVWPDDIILAGTGSGTFPNNQKYYQVTYEWTDANGFIHRSAPSPVSSSSFSASFSGINITIPTLQLTSKPNVRIVIYRASASQPTYYQVTSVESPLLNDTTSRTVTYTDSASDSDILGNTVLYTTGGVLENIPPPTCFAPTIYKSRLFVISSEDGNTIYYSKQNIAGVPVEMSPFLTIYVTPTGTSSYNTGPLAAMAVMDDKLIMFRSQGGIYYMTGNGPDNSGNNNDFTDPVSITSSIGCNNYDSVVVTQDGIMFQASNNAGIWLLGRDLSTQYIGAPVDKYNTYTILSAVLIPGTTQARFHLLGPGGDKIALVYDYYVKEWAEWTLSGRGATIWNGIHTYISNSQTNSGRIFKEYSNLYYDEYDFNTATGSPILISLKTAWMKLSNLQGYQRAYFFYLLGKWYSAHNLSLSMAYDYDDTNTQSLVLNNSTASSVIQWRVFLDKQRAEAIQLTLQEVFTGTYGASLTMSGINLYCGMKSSFKTIDAAKSSGGNS